MVRRYILLKSKKTKKVLGAIPIKLKATAKQIKIALSQLKKSFIGKIVTQTTLTKFLIKKKKKVMKRRKKQIRRKKKVVRRRKVIKKRGK